MRHQILIASLAAAAIALAACAEAARDATPATVPVGNDPFSKIATVLTHPRCMNCHTVTNFPRQGDDRHPHLFNVTRGPENKGAAGLHCATCHTAANQTASGLPGAPNWHLAPLAMGWEGLSVSQLCKTLVDKTKNGNRGLDALVAHMTEDPLVQWAWTPGAGRKPPSIGQQEFHQAVKAWAKDGGACPSG